MIHRLRPADSSDFEWLLALPRGREPGDAAERRGRFTRAFVAQPWWVVEVDREPVGALSVSWDDDPIVLHTVVVRPAWQGRGLGTRLVHDVLLQARTLARPVVVELPPGDPARAMFERLGLRPEPAAGDPRDDGEPEAPPARVRLRWAASVRTDVTLQAAMSPWADPTRRRAWARRLFAAPMDDAVGFCRFAAGRHGLPAELDALVMGVGTGALLPPLAALGWRLTAYEPDPDFCLAAARVAAAVGEAARVREGGPGQLDEVEAYDLAIALDGVLWALRTHEARVDAAQRLRRALRPGGLLLVEGPNMPWVLAANREPAVATEVYHRATVSRIPARTLDVHDGVLEHRDTFVVEVDGHEAAELTEVRHVALLGLPLVRLALEQAGLRVLETFRDLRATGPSRITGPRIVLTAQATG